ncbi:MAG: NADH-quinone oxidoreductase subunit J [Bryobacteraceae bacterium]
METAFYVAGAVAIAATVMALTRLNAVHALLYLVVSLLAVAVVFYLLGAPFVAALEVMIYAGAIMVLFVFVVMMLNLGERAVRMERALLTPGIWAGPSVLAAILIAEVFLILTRGAGSNAGAVIGPREVGAALYGPYLIGVELASMLLAAGLVGAYHLGWRGAPKPETGDAVNTAQRRTDAIGDSVLAGTGRTAGAAEPGVRTDVH